MKGRYNSRSDLRNHREEQQESEWILKKIENLCTAIIILCITVLMLFGMSSCSTISDKESYVYRHRLESMMSRIDSMVSRQQTVVTDSSWRETVIKQFESIRENNDTSRTMVVDSAGNIVKETVIINHVKEVSSESDRLEIQGMRHSMERMDSTLSVMQLQLERSDSLLQTRDKQRVVTKPVPWYRRLWNNIEYLLIGSILGAAIIVTRRWWSKLFKISK